MRTPRLILAALLLATPLLHAQEAETQKTEPKAAAAQDAVQPQQTPNPPEEPYRITITFKTTEGGKTTTQRSYMLVATTNQHSTNLGIRDNSHVTLTTGSNGSTGTFHLDTDVDLTQFKRIGNSAYLNLMISTEDLAEDPAAQASNRVPIVRSRHYTITPTLAIGKLVTVYSAVDAVNDAKVDVQVLVQPLDAK
jgi:hypothetical protein